MPTPSEVRRRIDACFDFAKKDMRGAFSAASPPELYFDHASDVTMLLHLIERLPEAVLPTEDADRIEYDRAVSAIRFAVEKWATGERHYKLGPIRTASGSRRHPLTTVRMYLDTAPDDPVAAVVAELAFITDADTREELGQDIEESRRALLNGAWKGSTVVAGSVIEGLLLWALDHATTAAQRQTALDSIAAKKKSEGRPWQNPAKPALEKWKLAHFVAVAAEVGLIDRETERQADLARDFRNYIHPGRVKSTRKRCDESTALLTRSAVLAVVKELQKGFP